MNRRLLELDVDKNVFRVVSWISCSPQPRQSGTSGEGKDGLGCGCDEGAK